MHTVADELDHCLAASGGCQRRTGRTGLVVVERSHPVEQMGHQGPTSPETVSSVIERGIGGVGVGIGVPDRGHQAAAGQDVDDRVGGA